VKIGTIFRKDILNDFNKSYLGNLILLKSIDFLLIYFLVPTLSFVLYKILPGSPFDNEFVISPTIRSQLESSWHLSQDVGDQFWNYLKSFLYFDFGYSLVRPGQMVGALIVSKLKESFLLLFMSISLAYFSGIVFAVCAVIPGLKKTEAVLDIVAKILTSLPALVLAPMMVYIFSYRLSWFPVAFLNDGISFILPIFALSLRAGAIIYRYLKSELKLVMNADYIRFGRSKGLSLRYLALHHALPISLPVILTFSPSLIIGVISGAFLVENIFAIPGVASEFVHALQSRDYPVMTALFFCFALAFYALTSLCEVLRARLDPRFLEGGK